jgi:hypothetical protein
MNKLSEQWPELPYKEFLSTSRLLHMGMQAIGKLKLNTPFEPHWANVALWLTSRGLTTGPISYNENSYSIDLDFISHEIICTTSLGENKKFNLTSMSVSQFTEQLFSLLKSLHIESNINMMPQEIPDPIPFDQDNEKREYDKKLAHSWWKILLSSYHVMQQYHSHFNGETPPIGLMWGTFDLRDARYNGTPVPTTGINASYIRRNAMDEAQVEVGFWSGNPAYQKAAYFSFTYPQPPNIEQAKIKPAKARWEKDLATFILDYDDVRYSSQPNDDLLSFFESTYEAGAKCAGWNSKLIVEGVPK